MRCLIIYKSIHHGNTRKVAEAIAEVLNAELVRPQEINPEEILSCDLTGFGSGIYYFQHHRELLKLVERLPEVRGRKAFIFSTAGINLPFIYHRKLRKKLSEKGFEIIGEFSCRGWDTYGLFGKLGGISKGHPDERDLENARKFAEKIKENFRRFCVRRDPQ
ncbi:MAG: flavodoxin family protein [Archaeoglobi archaeon]|nr:flavodoxin family protein [Candidatus Mnemosynella bozhongmuii]